MNASLLPGTSCENNRLSKVKENLQGSQPGKMKPRKTKRLSNGRSARNRTKQSQLEGQGLQALLQHMEQASPLISQATLRTPGGSQQSEGAMPSSEG